MHSLLAVLFNAAPLVVFGVLLYWLATRRLARSRESAGDQALAEPGSVDRQE